VAGRADCVTASPDPIAGRDTSNPGLPAMKHADLRLTLRTHGRKPWSRHFRKWRRHEITAWVFLGRGNSCFLRLMGRSRCTEGEAQKWTAKKCCGVGRTLPEGTNREKTRRQ
jgi:hypothetical protein